jgi:integrase
LIQGKIRRLSLCLAFPARRAALAELQFWRPETTYAANSDWGFASEPVFLKLPIWSNTSLQKVLKPAAKRAGITKKIGWHTFRHIYSTLLSE